MTVQTHARAGDIARRPEQTIPAFVEQLRPQTGRLRDVGRRAATSLLDAGA